MKIICIEEHTVDMAIQQAAQPVMMAQAPYLVHQSSDISVSGPVHPDRPSRVRMTDALAVGADLGEGRIKAMDAFGIDVQLVSYVAPVQLLSAEDGPAAARKANDRLARAMAERPDRLGGFALLPWQDSRSAIEELDRAVNALGFRGVLIAGRPGATFLDDARYFDILKKIAELDVPLYVHPYYPVPGVYKSYYDGLPGAVSAEFALGAWGWHHEAGVHVLRMILSGIFEKLPTLKLISGHWGEMVPFFLERLDFVISRSLAGLSRSIGEIYRSNVWVTPSGMFDLPHFEFVHKVLGAERIIWSTDYPFLTMNGAREFLEGLPASDADRALIAHGNAEKLFRL